MKIKHNEYGEPSRYNDEEIDDITERHLNGDDYERGELEATRATADNAVKTLGKLLNILAEKELLSIKEIKEILELNYLED